MKTTNQFLNFIVDLFVELIFVISNIIHHHLCPQTYSAPSHFHLNTLRHHNFSKFSPSKISSGN